MSIENMGNSIDFPSSEYRVSVTPKYQAVLHATSAELLSRAMREDREPHEDDIKILSLESNTVIVPDLEVLATLSEEIRRFHERTDWAVTELKCDFNNEVAESLASERIELGELAQELAEKLREEIAFQQALGPTGENDPDQWLRNLTDES